MAKKRSREEMDDSKYNAKKQDAVIKVEDFANRRGVNKGLEKFKERKETKRVQTASALKYYKKVMKKEGYDAGAGASRKRPRNDNDDSHAAVDTTATSVHKKKKEECDKRKSHYNPVAKKTDQRKQQEEERRVQAEQRVRQKEVALRKRRQRHKLLTARTAKGQPIMKNLVQDILNQLQDEKNDK